MISCLRRKPAQLLSSFTIGLIFCCLSCSPAFGQSVIATVPVGTGPEGIGVNPVTNRWYVTNRTSSDVSVVDGESNQVVATVPTGLRPIGIAVNPVTNKIYAAAVDDGTVTVIDGTTNAYSVVQVGVFPIPIGINTVTNKIYVVNGCGNDVNCQSAGTVTVIDGVTNGTTTIPVGSQPGAIAVNSVTNKIYVTNSCGNDPTCATMNGTVSIIDGATNTVSTINVGNDPAVVDINPVTNQIYVANGGDNTVSIIDGSTNNMTTVNTGLEPDDVAVNSVTNKIYVGNFGANTVTVIDGTTHQTTTVTVGNEPTEMAVNTTTNEVYVVNESDNSVTMIDGPSNAATRIGVVGIELAGMGINPVTNRVYVASFHDNTVSVIAGGVLPTPLQFVAITPCRLLDTRQTGNPIQGGTFQTYNIPQLAQENGCNSLPANGAYSLNVTLIPWNHQRVSYLTVWPAGQTQPTVSTMNSPDGRTKADATIVPAGVSGAINVYATDKTDLVLDIDGYFAASGPSTLVFHPLTPCRVADTRSEQYPQGLGAPYLSGGVARDFPVLNSSCIPQQANAAAYSFNITAVPYPGLGSPLGYLELWPTNQQPSNPVSTLNNPTGTTVANAAIVPAGTGGSVTVYPSHNTNLLIDVNGYFSVDQSGGMSLYSRLPCRALDTRGMGSGQAFGGTLQPPADIVNSGCGIPTSAEAIVFNATAIPSPTLNYLTLWPDGQPQPGVSTLNAIDGFVTSNMAIVPSTNGTVDAFAQGTTQLILDISSYFAP
jgi:YVTN family beta-propeller protein